MHELPMKHTLGQLFKAACCMLAAYLCFCFREFQSGLHTTIVYIHFKIFNLWKTLKSEKIPTN